MDRKLQFKLMSISMGTLVAFILFIIFNEWRKTGRLDHPILVFLVVLAFLASPVWLILRQEARLEENLVKDRIHREAIFKKEEAERRAAMKKK